MSGGKVLASPDEVVSRLADGMTVGIGGWGSRRKPMALVRAILRSPLKDLTVVSYGGPDVGLLCAAGKVSHLVYGFVSLDSIALEPHFRAAAQSGAIRATALDEGMLQWGLYAASLRLPFLPTRAGLGSDVMTLYPDLKTVTSPYDDGEELVAMPGLPLDAALVHVHRADDYGNSQILGPDPYFDDLFCRAATDAYVSCEALVSTDELTAGEHALRTLALHRMDVSGVVETPRGAHFTECPPYYGRDEAFQKAYAKAARDAEAWSAFSATFLEVEDEAAYQAAVGPAPEVSS